MQFPNKPCGTSSEYIHPLYLISFFFLPIPKINILYKIVILHFLTHSTLIPRIWYDYDPSSHPTLYR